MLRCTVSTMIARFKEHTQNGHVKIRKQQLRRRRSHVVLACTNSPEFDHAGGVEPGPAGSKATATVFHAVIPHRPIGVCTFSWAHTGESDVRLTSSALLAGLRQLGFPSLSLLRCSKCQTRLWQCCSRCRGCAPVDPECGFTSESVTAHALLLSPHKSWCELPWSSERLAPVVM